MEVEDRREYNTVSTDQKKWIKKARNRRANIGTLKDNIIWKHQNLQSSVREMKKKSYKPLFIRYDLLLVLFTNEIF